MGKSSNQRVMLTKRLLKESLMELMKEKSIQKISAVELCQKAGINRSTFYTHYGCVPDVLTEMENDMIEDLQSLWESRCKGAPASQNRIQILCDYLREHEATAKTILGCNDVDSDFAQRLIGSYFVREIFEETVSERFSSHVKDILFDYLTCGEYSMIRYWLLSDIPMTSAELSALINDVSVNGWMKRL